MLEKENILLGSLYILIAALSFSIMGAFVKYASKTISDDQILFLRNLVGLILVSPTLLFPRPKNLKTSFFVNHFIRAVASVLALYCLYYAIRHIFLADAILLNNTMPLFVPFILYFWHKEKFPKAIILPLIISFVGVILVLRPGANLINTAAIVALLSGLFMGISTVGVRYLGTKEPFWRIMFYTFSISTLITLFPLFRGWKTPDLREWGALLAVGLFGYGYQFCIIKGYRIASPAKVSPLIYLSVVISGVIDWLFWHQAPGWISYVGLVLIVIGAYFCTKGEEKSLEGEKR